MVTQVSLIARSAEGKVQTYQYKPGAKHSAQQNTIYKLVVDGSEQIPPGTKIFRKGNDIVVQFSDGQVFEIGDWCSVAGSRLIDLDNAQALDAPSATYVAAKEIGSGACLIAGEGGQGAGALGEADQGAAAGAAAGTGGGFNPILLAPLALLGLAGGGGGGGGDGGGGGTKLLKPSGSLATGSDSGAQGDFITKDDTPTISGTGGTPGQTIQVRDAGGSVLGTGIVNADGTWSVTPSAPLPEGLNNLNVIAVDGSGIASDPLRVPIIIDKTPPAVAGLSAPDMTDASDTGSSNTDDATTNNRPVFRIAAPGVGETPVLMVDGVEVAATFDPATSTLTPVDPIADGAHSITTTLRDVAGNTGAASPALTINIDATPPAAPLARLDPADDSGTLGDGITNEAQPAISGTGTPGDTITVTFPGGAIQTTTVNAQGTWSVVSPAPLAEGPNILSITATDPFGNVSGPTTLTVTIDTNVPAAPAAPDLSNATDLGVSDSDNNTSDNTPDFTGTGAEPNATITLYDTDGSTILGTTTADGSGNWSITASAMSEGVHNVTIRQTDRAGNVSIASPALAVTVDSVAPAPLAAPNMTAATDTGISDTDDVTNDTTPDFTGTGAEPNAGITLYDTDGTTVLGTTTADTSGNWSITASNLSDGGHQVTVKQTDGAGNVSSTSPALAVTVDSAAAPLSAPDLAAAADSGVSDTDDVTSINTPKFIGTGAEPGATITLYDTDGTTLLGTTTADGSGNWAITTTTMIDGLHNVTVKQADLAGNSSAASPALAVTIDTTAPAALTAPDLTAATDLGISNSDNNTSDNTPTFTGTGAQAGATVTLYDSNGVTVLGTTTADALGDWTITATSMTNGTHNVTVKQADAAGNTSVASAALAVVIDTIAPDEPRLQPDMTAATDSGVSNIDDVTSDATPDFTVAPNAGVAGQTVTLYVDGVAAGTTTVALNGSFVVTPSAAIADGAHDVTYSFTDIAGNESLKSPSLTVTIDTTAPAALAAPDLTDATDSGVSNNDNITNGKSLDFTGAGALPNATVTLYDSDGTTVLGTTTVDPSGNWTITTDTPSEGVHNLTVKQTDVAGNISAPSEPLVLTIDTTKPADLTAPDLTSATDGGASDSDNITNDKTPTFTGSGALANATITLYDSDGTTVLGTSTADALGNWTVTATDMIDDVHNVSVTQTDAAGNTSAASPSLAVTIDTVVDALTAPDLTDASDSGASNIDNTTNDNTPSFTGKGAEPGATITLYDTDGTTVLATTTADAAGNWSVTASTLSDGAHDVTVKQTDLAGNTSAASAPLSVTIDTTAPAALAAPDLTDASDSGASDSDNITNGKSLELVGAGALPNATITLYDSDGTTVLGTAIADGAGNWSITPASALSDGPHTLTVTQLDAAGNESAPSSGLNVTIDTTGPTAPSITAIPESTAGGISLLESTDGTPAGTPVLVSLSGSGAQAGDSLILTWGGQQVIQMLTAGDVTSGSASVTVPTATIIAQGNGTFNVTAQIRDLAGNIGADAGPSSVTVDTVAPGAPGAPVIPEAAPDINGTEASNGTPVTVDLTGTGAVAGDTLIIDWGGQQVSYTLLAADISGNSATVTISAVIVTTAAENVPFNVTASLIDQVGNIGPSSAPASVTVDTTPPPGPQALDLDDADDSGSSATDNITSQQNDLTIIGTALVGNTVRIYRDVNSDGAIDAGDELLADAVPVDGSGNFTADIKLSEGVHNLLVTQVDGSSNESEPGLMVVTVDATTPKEPPAPSVTENDSGGINAQEAADGTNVDVSLAGTGAEVGDTLLLAWGGQAPIAHVLRAADIAAGTVSIALSAVAIATEGDGDIAVSATLQDRAGNTSLPGTTSVKVDTVAPNAPIALDLDAADDSGSSNSDDLTRNTTKLTITGNGEDGASVTLFNDIDNDGVIDAGEALGTGIVAKGAFEIDVSLPVGVQNVKAIQADAAGNIGPASATLVITVDTTLPITLSAPDLSAASDSGVSDADDITNVTTPSFTGSGALPNALITLYDSDGTAVLGTAIADEFGVWTITASTLSDGLHNLSVTQTDNVGNESAPSPVLAVTIDTGAPEALDAPDLTTASDSGASSKDDTTSDTTPTFTGNSKLPGATITLYDSDGITVLGTAVADVFGNWSITSTPLPDGVHNVTVTQTDAAGNESPASPPLTVTIDTTVPAALSAPDLAALSDSGVSDSDDLTKDTTPDFTGTGADADATVTLYDSDGISVLGTTTADALGNWTITALTLLAGVHNVTVKQTDVAGNTSAASPALAVTIDTSPPAALTAPDLTTATDTGSSSTDNITGDNTGDFSGSGAEANAAITLYDTDGTTVLGNTTADALGNWTITASTMTDGVHTVVIRQADAAGNLSTASPGLAVTVDTTVPVVPAPDMTAATDSGTSNTDNITNDNTPTFTLPAGTAQTGDIVELLVNGVVVAATISVNLDGSVTATPTGAIADGISIPVAFRITDVAGNVGTSPNLNITVDTVAPAAPSKSDLLASSDSGISNSDDITNDTTPTLTGAGALPNALITLYNTDGVTVLGTTTADAAGSWSFTPLTPLSPGAYSFKAAQMDAAGNQSALASSPLVTIDTTAPPSLSAPDLTSAADSGSSNTDNITNDNTPTFTGSGAIVGATVTLYDSDGTTVLGTAIVDKFGVWTITATTLTDGVHNVSVTQADTAGNQAVLSPTLAVTVDTVAPGAPTVTAATTSDTTPTITGTWDSAGATSLSVVVNGVTYTVGDGNLTTSGSTWSLTVPALNTLAAGTYEVAVSNVDAAGNSTGDVSSNELVITSGPPANNAPVLDASKSPALSTPEYVFSGGGDAALQIPAGASPTGSVAISSLVDFASPSGQVDNVTDIDASPILGVGITALTTNPNATLWYTTDGGTTWNWTTNVIASDGSTGLYGNDGFAGTTDDRVLLLDPTAKIIFDGGNSGLSASLSDAITFRAWDQTTGTNGSFVTNPTTGGSTSLSAATDTVQASFTAAGTLPANVIDLSRLDAAAGVRIAGGVDSAKFGWDVSGAGDVNGDGFEDFIVAQFLDGGSRKGSAFLFHGQSGSYGATNADGTRTLDSSAANATFTRTTAFEEMTGLSNLGDINNDGYSDFMLSGDSATNGSGQAYVIFGKAGGVSSIASLDATTASTNWFRITTTNGGIGRNNHTVSWVGDVNGDGYDDLAIGTPLADPRDENVVQTDGGATFVVYGHAGTTFGANNNLNFDGFFASNFDGIADTGGAAGHALHAATNTRGLITFSTGGQQFGNAIDSVGDRNGDGYTDYMGVFAKPSVSGAQGYILHGNLTAATGGNITWTSGTFPAGVESSQIGAGTGGTTANNSRIRVTGPGGGTFPPTEPNRVDVEGLGDVNGDGLSDWALSYQFINNGDVYVVYGNTAVLNDGVGIATLGSGTTGFKISGALAGDKLGESIRSLGDINGDGYDDFVVGAPNNEVGTASNQGGSYVIYGGAGLAGSTVDLSIGLAANKGIYIRGNITGDQAGFAVSGAGDVNGDGLDDLLVGAPFNDQGATDAGAAYLIYGNTAYGNVAGQVGASLTGTAAADALIGTGAADTISGSGGADALSGGAGDDLLIVSDAGFRRVDGGTGVDTLRLSGSGLTLDFDAQATALSGRVRNVEVIDITGSGNNTLKVNLQDVFVMSETRNTVRVDGDAGDVIQIAQLTTAWTDGGRANFDGTANAAGLYHKFTQGTGTLIIDEDITRATF